MIPITFTTLVDPIVDEHGYPACSEYTEMFWLPVIGPTAFCILRRINTELRHHGRVTLDLEVLANSMGLSLKHGMDRSPFGRALGRLTMFGLAHADLDGTIRVRAMVPTVPLRMRNRWPLELQNRHVESLNMASAAR